MNYLNDNKRTTFDFKSYFKPINNNDYTYFAFDDIDIQNAYCLEKEFIDKIQTKSSFNILSFNICSLAAKFNELNVFLTKVNKKGKHIDILLLQEIYLI